MTCHRLSFLEAVETLVSDQKTQAQKCGSAPKSKDDCKGINEDGYACQIRRMSDDATFHAQMKWNEVLLEDFNKLVELENNQELSEVN